MSSVYRDAVLATTGLVSFWRLGEASGTTVLDETANGRNGVNNGATVGAVSLLASDTANTAYSFNGVNSFLNWGTNPVWAPVSTGTFVCWIKFAQAATTILNGMNVYALYTTGGELRSYDYAANIERLTGRFINDGATHQVAMSWQLGVTNGTLIYVDGALVLTTTTGTVASAGDLALASNATTFFGGIMDDAAMWSSVQSAATIADLYTKGTSAAASQPLTGSSVATSATAASLQARQLLTGASVATATTTASLAVRATIIGSSAGTSATLATLAVRQPLTGASAAASATLVVLGLAQPLTGSSFAASTTAGTLTLTGEVALAGASVSAGATAATLSLATPLAGASIAASTTAATIALSGQAVLTGTSASTSTTVAALRVAQPLTGTSLAPAKTAAALQAAVALTGASLATATTEASLATRATLTGSSVGTSLTVASLKLPVPLTGASVAESATAATLLGAVALTGTSASASATAARLSLVVPIIGTSVSMAITGGWLTVSLPPGLVVYGVVGQRATRPPMIATTVTARPEAITSNGSTVRPAVLTATRQTRS